MALFKYIAFMASKLEVYPLENCLAYEGEFTKKRLPDTPTWLGVIQTQMPSNAWQMPSHCYQTHTCRAVASLTDPGGQKFLFPHFSSNFNQIVLFLLKFFPFSSSFWPSGWASCPPGKALATPLHTCISAHPAQWQKSTEKPGLPKNCVGQARKKQQNLTR